MAYREENGEVILTMSYTDYELLAIALGSAVGLALQGQGEMGLRVLIPMLNRLNEGNPGYTPYRESKF